MAQSLRDLAVNVGVLTFLRLFAIYFSVYRVGQTWSALRNWKEGGH